MLDYSNIGVLPVSDGAITKGFNLSNHRGLDFGWIDTKDCDILAWQDGIVVEAESYKTGGDRGEYCVIEHSYNGGLKRWSGYLHLLENSLKVKKGDAVKMGQVIGKRGNTGKSNGDHLHLYLSRKNNSNYTYSVMKRFCDEDPTKWLYIDENLNKKIGENIKSLPLLPYPTPVERNEEVNQILINHPNKWLRLRSKPNGDIYDKFCINGIYNIYDKQKSGAYDWYKIDEIDGSEFWVAYSENWATLLDAKKDYKSLYDQVIIQLNDCLNNLNELDNANKQLQQQLNDSNVKLNNANNTIDAIKKIIEK